MLGAIVDRLSAAGLRADVAEDLDAITRGVAPASATTWVVSWREQARPNTRATGGHLQAVTARFIVAHIVRREDDAKGSIRAVLVDAPKALTEGALAGWSPTPGASALLLVSGEFQSLGNGVSVYAQVWECVRYLTGGRCDA